MARVHVRLLQIECEATDPTAFTTLVREAIDTASHAITQGRDVNITHDGPKGSYAVNVRPSSKTR